MALGVVTSSVARFARHVESQVYEQVGKEEIEVGIESTKEVLKA
jgi:hypothetical protein